MKSLFGRNMMLALLLMVTVTAMAQLKEGHFFKTLENEYVAVEHAEKYFPQWFSLPAGTEWRLVGSSTDQLGMSRIEYHQYVDGIEVEHSQILLHARNGRVETANGTVMEQHRTPQASNRLRRSALSEKDGKLVDQQGREVYLIDTKDGYRYAYKVRSEATREWIYTDVETGARLKAVPMSRSLTKPTGDAVKAKGQGIFCGDVEMDVTKSADGKTWLYDQTRNIHTILGAYLPSFSAVEKYPEYKPDEKNKDYTAYLLDSPFASYLGAEANEDYKAYKVNKLTITKLMAEDLSEEMYDLTLPLSIFIGFRYGMDTNLQKSEGAIESIEMDIKQLPFELDLSEYQEVLPREGMTVILYPDAGDKQTFTFKPDATGTVSFKNKFIEASMTYEPSGDPVTDVHWGMGKTYDFYKTVFNRNSFDDKGSSIYNLVYIPDDEKAYPLASTPNNAMAETEMKPYPMIYGMGEWVEKLGHPLMKPVVELSVMSHEFTHLVTEQTAQLEYVGESGALNESFSDLMGISCQKWVEGENTGWLMGDDELMIGKGNMRDMQYPKNSQLEPNPDTYEGEYWANTEDLSSDYGGVHINSGVMNKWYYLLTDGGKGTNDKKYSYDVKGIGIEKSQQIAYRTLVQYATKTSQYADIRKQSLQAAKDLYQNGTETDAVAKAWDAVGVYENGVQPTGIYQISTERSVDNNYYDLHGRPVTRLGQGVYIHQSKKVVH